MPTVASQANGSYIKKKGEDQDEISQNVLNSPLRAMQMFLGIFWRLDSSRYCECLKFLVNELSLSTPSGSRCLEKAQ